MRVFLKDNEEIVGESYGDTSQIYCCSGDVARLIGVVDLIALGWIEIDVVLPNINDFADLRGDSHD